jgi:antitoxin (DNA-binding transcriptional repressor) of toxin-antitoxin stability system
MKKASVRDLRYRFPEIEARLNKGEEILIHKRRKAIARMVPVRPATGAYPDFEALSRRIFGRKKTRQTGTDLVSHERGDD